MQRVLIDNINYWLDSDTLTASVCSLEKGKYGGDIVIPATLITCCAPIIGYGVTSIGDFAFCGCECLTSITIPNSVTCIGDSAFEGCTMLTSIVVESGNTKYDSHNKCNAIIETATNTLIVGCQNTIIPDSITSIGDGAFMGCTELTSITIPNSVTSIENWAFCGCIGIASITIPDSVTNIGQHAFSNCTNLTSIVVGSGNQKYDSRNNCNAILEKDSNTLIQGCQNTIIPDSITSIGDGAFMGCTELTSITIPNSVTSVGDEAFCGCTGLASITIPNSVTSIGEGTFCGCESLTSIIIPNSVTSIGSCAFNGCNRLSSIIIPNSVTSIGSSAFDNTPWLDNQPNGKVYINTMLHKYKGDMPAGSNIVVRKGTTSIGNSAFKGSIGLTSITIPDSVTMIGRLAFLNCEALSSIRIPQGKQSIFDADNLKELQDKIIEYTPAQIDSVQYELDSDLTAIVCAKAEKYAGEVVVPMRVEHKGTAYIVNRLGERAFADCYELTAVTLPKSITEIGKDVFLGCENLQTIRVPQGMTDKFCQMGLEPWRDKIVEPRQEEYTILLNIAKGYELGIGMARNLAQAVLCYVQAADKGCAEAAYHLGELYAEGKGLPQDYQQAADWFGKAAALYHPNGTARQQECLRIIEQEAARLAAFEQEQQAERQAQLARITAAPKSQKAILFFDTETNGLPRNYKADITNTFNWPRLIQLGWLITDEAGNILKRKSQLIYPHFTIDTDVTRLTGITTAQAQREGVDLAQVLREFAADAAGASLIVGHNIDFDLHVVGCELYREGMDYRALLNQPTVCTMQRSTDFCAIPSTNSYYSGYKYPTLTELYTKLFGHAFSGAHDALTDITATKDCYFELRKRGII